MNFRQRFLSSIAVLLAAGVAAAYTDAADAKLPLTPGSAFPAPNAMAICPDAPLRLTFATPPTLGAGGKIRICEAASAIVVETIDVGLPTATKTIGGLPNYNYYPVIIDGNQATIFPRNHALSYGKSYYVTLDAGVFKNGNDGYAGIDQPKMWQFTTKAAPPKSGTARLVVAADGTGDFCTVQGALDYVPDGNTTPVTILLRKGTYVEIVFFTNKHAITLLGEDRKECVIAYATNERFNPAGGNPYAGSSNPSAAPLVGGNIYHRGVFLAHRVNDLVLTNLTIRNTTPQGGSQAEAIILNGSTTARAILKDVDLYSYQDTLQINGQAYLNNCFIEGDVDFMWGTGPCFFENCTARSLRSGAYYTQIRNPASNHGYVYLRCTFDGAQGIMGNFLSRIGAARFPASEVVLLDCVLGNAVGPVAWQFQGPGDASNVHFWEFNSHTADGKPVDVRLRMPGSRQLKQPDDAMLITTYSSPAFVLGNDWNPKSASIFATPHVVQNVPPASGTPVITTQPASQLALLGTNPCLTVVASGSAGRLNYEWRKNGHPITGVTSPLLRIDHMKSDDAAIYTVLVSNSAGAVTSDAAELIAVAPATLPAAAPQLPVIPGASFDVTSYGAVGDGTTDNTAAIQKTIDTAVTSGGGVVIIPAAPKPYLSGPITLGNAINLQIDRGATLQMLPYSAEPKSGFYPPRRAAVANLVGNVAFANLITANRAHDLALTGGGTIDGNGDAWWAAFRADRNLYRRPYLVGFNNCERVLVSGLTFTRSPMFHVALSAINHLTVFGITIRSPDGAPNTDGVDPSGTHHLIQNCDISVDDDNVVMKPGGVFCSDITIADCAFGTGHGMSVGGQSNRGLDGMIVKNCTFDSTTSGLRLKADAMEGGEVKNISYANLTMRNVDYPIVFYSYYKPIGDPGSLSGNNQTTPEKVKAWNASPPNSLASKTLPSWKNITVSNLTSTGTKAFSVIWGLPLEGYLIENVKLNNVRIMDGPGFEIFDATNVQFTGDTEVGNLLTANALAITSQPQNQTIAPGASTTFKIGVAGTSGTKDSAPTYRWNLNGTPLIDGKKSDGTLVSGSATATLKLAGVQASSAGKYAVTVSNTLDTFDVAANALAADKTAVSATSNAATLTVASATR